jgi:hypothetical protein
LERSLTNYENLPDDQEKVELDVYMDIAPIVESPTNEIYEKLERKGDKELPPSELKPLSEEVRYEFLDETNNCPIIVNANLSDNEGEKLMKVLKEHRGAFGYSLNDLKGISP